MGVTVVAQPPGPSPVIRSTLLALVASSAGWLLLPATPALAQAANAVKPASQEDVATYTTMGAVASCDLAVRQQIPLAKTLPATSAMVAYVLSIRHGSEIKGVSNGKLSNEQLMQGSYIQIVGAIRRGCYDKLNEADKKEIDNVVTQLEKAAAAEKNKK